MSFPRPPLRVVRHEATQPPSGPPPDPPDMPPPDPPTDQPRPLRKGSYLSAVRVIEEDLGGVVGGKLEWNDMLYCPTLNRLPLLDVDITTMRSRIEQRVTVGRDKHGEPVGLEISRENVHDAVMQVSRKSCYQPVREYLESLSWDGVERLRHAVVDILHADDTALNVAILRRWFISAVARPMQPGCKVDTVLVLVGGQGYFKSTFFKALASDEWFVDSPIDISSKDAFITLRRAWILEWAELESLARARDAGAVKAFLASSQDVYRPPYGRLDVRVERAGVIVATVNPSDGFLADETGNRRWWPLAVRSPIDITTLMAQRDQLWAEAVHLYRSGEAWWLTPGEEQLLRAVHEEHAVSDAWEQCVVEYVADVALEPTTAHVLEHAVKKPRELWTRADEHRVGRILRRHGWEQKKSRGLRRWIKP